MSGRTKKELLTEIEQLKKDNFQLKKVNAKLEKEKEAQNGSWEYLYTAEDMTTDYIDNLVEKTSLVRERIFYKEDVRTFAQIRQFNDGNQVMLINDFNRQTKEQHQYAMFYKKATTIRCSSKGIE